MVKHEPTETSSCGAPNATAVHQGDDKTSLWLNMNPLRQAHVGNPMLRQSIKVLRGFHLGLSGGATTGPPPLATKTTPTSLVRRAAEERSLNGVGAWTRPNQAAIRFGLDHNDD